MLNNLRLVENVTSKLSQLADYVSTINNLGLTDVNHCAEDLICELLNVAYDWNLRNLNKKEKNHPAVDLGDEITGIGVAVTSDNKATYITRNIETFKERKHQLYKKYPKLRFYIISTKGNYPKLKVKTENLFEFDKSEHIWDKTNLIQALQHDLDKLRDANDILNKYFNEVFPSLERITEENKRYLNKINESLILGKDYATSESVKLFELANNSAQKGVLITGNAGQGKSVVMYQVAKELLKSNIPIMTIRLDKLETSRTPKNLGKQLYDISESPVKMLNRITYDSKAFLFIDQLDAISLTSGRNPHFYDCIKELIDEALECDNIVVIIACREFDIKRDPRLLKLNNNEHIFKIQITKIDDSTLSTIITELGYNFEEINQKQKDILRIPLHLKLLSETKSKTLKEKINSITVQDLFNEFWEDKKAILESDYKITSEQLFETIELICAKLIEFRSLSLHKRYLEKYSEILKKLTTVNILTESNEKVSFFHESFYDYIYGRQFVISGRSLQEFLEIEEQHLYKRNQVRQILLHERDLDKKSFEKYLSDLKYILSSKSNVRFHIKKSVFDVITELIKPSVEEWEILRSILENGDFSFKREIWGILKHSVPWFILVNKVGFIKDCFEKNDEDKLNWLTNVFYHTHRLDEKVGDIIADLLTPYKDTQGIWRERLRYIMQIPSFEISYKFLHLYIYMLDKGYIDDFEPHFYNIIKNKPEWACELFKHYLERRLAIAQQAGFTNPFSYEARVYHDNVFNDTLYKLSETTPISFVENIKGFFLKLILNNLYEDSKPPIKDAVWSYRNYKSEISPNEFLLKAFDIAISKIAEQYTDLFLKIFEEIKENDWDTTNFLLIRAMRKNPTIYADIAAEYLLENTQRFKAGWSITGGGDAYYLATTELLEAISSFCSVGKFTKLEQTIVNFETDFEKSKEGIKLNAKYHSSYILLKSLDADRLSENSKRRLEELHRKFSFRKQKEPIPSKAGAVPSPIASALKEKFSDDNWISAMNKYNSHTDSLKGDIHQVSYDVQIASKSDPPRFANLLLERFDNTIHSSYFGAILHGITDAYSNPKDSFNDSEVLISICKKSFDVYHDELGLSICWVMYKLGNSITKELYYIAQWYALNNTDKVIERRDLLNDGFNSVRGLAGSVIEYIIGNDKSTVDEFIPVIKKLAVDESLAVRNCIIPAITQLLNFDPDLSISIFVMTLDGNDTLLTSNFTANYLNYALQIRFESLEFVIERMLKSDDEKIVEIVATNIWGLSRFYEFVKKYCNMLQNGTEIQRIMSAKVIASVLHDIDNDMSEKSDKAIFLSSLKEFFNDESKEVRKTAAFSFRYVESKLDDYSELIKDFIDSKAFNDNPSSLIFALNQTTSKLPEITCDVCEKFMHIIDEAQIKDVSSHLNFDFYIIPQLVIRTYSQHMNNPRISTRCLDLIDKVLELGEETGVRQGFDDFQNLMREM